MTVPPPPTRIQLGDDPAYVTLASVVMALCSGHECLESTFVAFETVPQALADQPGLFSELFEQGWTIDDSDDHWYCPNCSD